MELYLGIGFTNRGSLHLLFLRKNSITIEEVSLFLESIQRRGCSGGFNIKSSELTHSMW